MQSENESFLDPSKEIEMEDNLVLEGFPLEFEKRMSMSETSDETYDEATPIRMRPVMKSVRDLDAYRQKRNKRNKAAKKSRRNNRKKK